MIWFLVVRYVLQMVRFVWNQLGIIGSFNLTIQLLYAQMDFFSLLWKKIQSSVVNPATFLVKPVSALYQHIAWLVCHKKLIKLIILAFATMDQKQMENVHNHAGYQAAKNVIQIWTNANPVLKISSYMAQSANAKPICIIIEAHLLAFLVTALAKVVQDQAWISV